MICVRGQSPAEDMKMTPRTLVVPALLAFAAISGAQGMPWAKDFKAAKSAAEKSKKLIMIDFYTEW